MAGTSSYLGSSTGRFWQGCCQTLVNARTFFILIESLQKPWHGGVGLRIKVKYVFFLPVELKSVDF